MEEEEFEEYLKERYKCQVSGMITNLLRISDTTNGSNGRQL